MFLSYKVSVCPFIKVTYLCLRDLMASSSRIMREMEESFATVRLEDEEDGGLVYEGVTEETLSEIDVRWCLVGMFLTDAPIDFQAMQHKMASLWRPGRGVYIKEIERNRFIFQFYHEVDIKRVIEGSPWTFGRFQLVFERLKPGDDPRSLVINRIDLWVQLHGMQPDFMSQRVVQDIGNYIGGYVESDSNNFMGVWRDYLRVRVSVPLDKPLKRRMKLKKSESNWCWVNFRYEGVPTFCFICGLMGHNEKFCDKIFDTPLESIEKPYGIWMKAEPRRRNHTMGSKWLRNGGQNPVNIPVSRMDVRREDSEIIVKDNHNPKILGNIRAIAGTVSTQSGGVISGIGCNDIVPVNSQRDNLFESSERAGDLIMGHGPLVMVQKRRRTDGLEFDGPRQDKSHEDVSMTEIQEFDEQNQKNEGEASAALRARLEL